MKVTNTILAIVGIVIAFLAGYDKITENISDLTKTIGFPIMIPIKIAGLILFLYLLSYLLLMVFNKKNITKEIEKFPRMSRKLEKTLLELNRKREFNIKDEHNLSYSDEQLRSYLNTLSMNGYARKFNNVNMFQDYLLDTYLIHERGSSYLVYWKLIWINRNTDNFDRNTEI